jgi:hypothetical protein
MVAATGCSALRPVSKPAEFVAEQQPELVRVVEKQNGAVLLLVNPTLNGDTLIGMRPEGRHRVALPLDQIHSLSARRIHGPRTALLLGAMAALTGLTTYAILTNGADNNWECDYSSPAIGEEYSVPICAPRFSRGKP